MATLRSWLESEPFTLAMSSGFFGFFAHAGFVRALDEEGLRPVGASGSSAGALVASFLAAGLAPAESAELLTALERDQFWDPAPGLGFLRGELFRRKLEASLPVSSFERCAIPLAISTYDALGHRTRVFEKGALVPAIYASCAVPFMFQPIFDDGRPLWDGGVLDRPGLAGVPKGARVLYHHLASRSPWRRKNSPSLEVPTRPNLAAVVLRGLPRVGPFALELGPVAYEVAREATLVALDRPLESQRIDMTVGARAEPRRGRSFDRLDARKRNSAA
jgi:NTE family protein